MKRSEAVNQLQELLSNNDINFDAEIILNFLELNVGMSPPFSHKEFQKEWVRTRSPNCTGQIWEPENET